MIVGGGVIGTVHAREACRGGWEVVHLEADAGPRRASARNFGLAWVTGREAGSPSATSTSTTSPSTVPSTRPSTTNCGPVPSRSSGGSCHRWSDGQAVVCTVVTDDRIYYRHQADDAVWAATGPAGRGMTLAPSIAEQTWEELNR